MSLNEISMKYPVLTFSASLAIGGLMSKKRKTEREREDDDEPVGDSVDLSPQPFGALPPVSDPMRIDRAVTLPSLEGTGTPAVNL